MLTRADEYPVHQTPEPIAFAETDRNFYDRYFFNGFNADGSDFFAIAFGVYPHLNLADAHFATIRDGTQHCLHASKHLNMDRLDLTVGPICIEIVEPLNILRVKVDGNGIACDLLFEGRAFPIKEPRFTHRFGTRTFMDITRMTQNVWVSGWIEVDGQRRTFAPGAAGTRDRSWGVRSIGAPDQQPLADIAPPGVFSAWTPLHFSDHSRFFHVMAGSDGRIWNGGAVNVADHATAGEAKHYPKAGIDVELVSGTRHCASGTIEMSGRNGRAEIRLRPLRRFQMQGIGYGHKTWSHGSYHGDLAIEREDLSLMELDPNAGENIHVQDFSQALMLAEDGTEHIGFGTFEKTIVG